ncbi:MAG: ATP-binding protein, partial [Actinomycetota bacterium]
MKCRTCRGPAIIDLPRHNANFCAEHFVQLCRRQVTRAIEDFSMFGNEDRLLVAVSGGKDSLAVWDLLCDLGYRADGLYIGLGIGDYSDSSREYAEQFAADRNLLLHIVSVPDDYGFSVPTAAKATGRVPCSACGMSKRHIFDNVAKDKGYDVVVTGHNLDDEAAVLYGNVLRWDVEY